MSFDIFSYFLLFIMSKCITTEVFFHRHLPSIVAFTAFVSSNYFPAMFRTNYYYQYRECFSASLSFRLPHLMQIFYIFIPDK